MTFLEQVLFYIRFQINKHGQYNGWTTPEEVVNSLTNWELLQLIAEAVDNPPLEEKQT
jgi:hypothetical protein